MCRYICRVYTPECVKQFSNSKVKCMVYHFKPSKLWYRKEKSFISVGKKQTCLKIMCYLY